MSRFARCVRDTRETEIAVELNLDGTGEYDIDTGIGFFDHMLEGFARHGLFDLTVSVHGDTHVDAHHTVEDTGIVLGQAFLEALGEKEGISRFGYFILPWIFRDGRTSHTRRSWLRSGWERWRRRRFGSFSWGSHPVRR